MSDLAEQVQSANCGSTPQPTHLGPSTKDRFSNGNTRKYRKVDYFRRGISTKTEIEEDSMELQLSIDGDLIHYESAGVRIATMRYRVDQDIFSLESTTSTTVTDEASMYPIQRLASCMAMGIFKVPWKLERDQVDIASFTSGNLRTVKFNYDQEILVEVVSEASDSFLSEEEGTNDFLSALTLMTAQILNCSPQRCNHVKSGAEVNAFSCKICFFETASIIGGKTDYMFNEIISQHLYGNFDSQVCTLFGLLLRKYKLLTRRKRHSSSASVSSFSEIDGFNDDPQQIDAGAPNKDSINGVGRDELDEHSGSTQGSNILPRFDVVNGQDRSQISESDDDDQRHHGLIDASRNTCDGAAEKQDFVDVGAGDEFGTRPPALKALIAEHVPQVEEDRRNPAIENTDRIISVLDDQTANEVIIGIGNDSNENKDDRNSPQKAVSKRKTRFESDFRRLNHQSVCHDTHSEDNGVQEDYHRPNRTTETSYNYEGIERRNVAKELVSIVLFAIIAVLSILTIAFDPSGEGNWFKRIEEGTFVLFSLGIPLVAAMQSRLTENLDPILPKRERGVRTLRDLENMNVGLSKEKFTRELQKAMLVREDISDLFSLKNASYKITRKDGHLVLDEMAEYRNTFQSVWVFGRAIAFNRLTRHAHKYEQVNNVILIHRKGLKNFPRGAVVVHTQTKETSFKIGGRAESED